MTQTQWYKEAILYEVDVETFQDSNDDGVGDVAVAGLTSRLGTFRSLGLPRFTGRVRKPAEGSSVR
ncbi:hypothetical protein Deipe_4195 (plasmid) [Deinococcus peraridilitoris DSM 19664]|uniref:Uncharacterized protein n=1 Tax=Deinococcus peraridilitoris (strain DSM 19664 / LMG 22246 / CIP 109416 / KR-200) TaxID=937777 RepID=L0A801_DEIPD|nr:hypothetical protein Deipe_4195 [Deinococcus peraridilitoris DSM 19664]